MTLVRSVATWHMPGLADGRRSRRDRRGTGNRQGRSQPDCWNDRNPQARNRFCKPICKPDAAGQPETGETWKDRADVAAQVGRGQRDNQRLPETPETCVVWLITQRSRVQIPPPLPSLQVRGLFRSWKGPSACAVCTELRTRPLRRAAAATGGETYPRTSFATQAADGLPLRRGARTSAINCR